MDKLALVIALALVVEYITNILKPLVPNIENIKYPIPLVIALAVGITLTLTTQINLLNIIGLNTTNQYIGFITTGVIIAGGSTAVHELLAKLRESRFEKK